MSINRYNLNKTALSIRCARSHFLTLNHPEWSSYRVECPKRAARKIKREFSYDTLLELTGAVQGRNAMEQHHDQSWMFTGQVVASFFVIFVMLLIFLLHYTQRLSADVTKLRAELITHMSHDTKQTDFDGRVAQSINRLIEQQRQQAVHEKYEQYRSAVDVVPDGKHLYGDLNARFTLVEFSDLECAYCKQFHNTPKQIVDASKGHVNWQWKHLPLDFHNPVAFNEAVAAECVADLKGNKGFWVFIHEMFAATQGNGKGLQDIGAVVAGLDIDSNAFKACFESGNMQEKVQRDIQQASALGMTGTPATLVVDNVSGKHQLLAGAQPIDAVMAIIRKLSAEHAALGNAP
ncbi:MAG: DsbA family protein [Shewanella sp.]